MPSEDLQWSPKRAIILVGAHIRSHFQQMRVHKLDLAYVATRVTLEASDLRREVRMHQPSFHGARLCASSIHSLAGVVLHRQAQHLQCRVRLKESLRRRALTNA